MAKERATKHPWWLRLYSGLIAMVLGFFVGVTVPIPFVFAASKAAGVVVISGLLLNIMLWKYNHKISIVIFWLFGILSCSLILMFVLGDNGAPGCGGKGHLHGS